MGYAGRSAHGASRGLMRRAVWGCVGFLSLIMLVVVARRIVHLRSPSIDLDAGFARHPLLTLAHILPGLVFVLLGPFQFMAGLRKRRPVLHRWMGRIFLVDALVVGITALIMSPQMAIGGALESAATFTFGVVFLFALGKAFAAIRGRRVAEHRRWMIRGYAIGLAVAAVRPIVGVFFATSRLTHFTPHDFFGIAFWLGFILSVVAAELWIRLGIAPAG
jgi:uncharacterized membrane protein